MLYGAPIWQKAFQHKKYKERPGRVERLIALRVCSAYCTLSTVALQKRPERIRKGQAVR